jgi:hypothetical protein
MVDSSTWGSESAAVDLDLKAPAKKWALVVSWFLNVKCWNVGGLLWSLVCGRVPKFGYRISLSGELVPDFNYFKKFQVFKFLNPVSSCKEV